MTQESEETEKRLVPTMLAKLEEAMTVAQITSLIVTVDTLGFQRTAPPVALVRVSTTFSLEPESGRIDTSAVLWPIEKDTVLDELGV